MPILAVPEIPQWGAGANKLKNDCGPACVAMCLARYGLLQGRTVDQLALETPLAQHDVGLSCAQLVTLLARHGLPARVYTQTTSAALQAQIRRRRPVIILVAFRFILNRLDQADKVPGQDGHFLVVTGYDDTHFVMNDPDVWYPYVTRGSDMSVPVRELDLALAEYGNQSIVLEIEQMTIGDQIAALISEAESSLGEAKILAGQIGDTPPTLPGVTMWTTAALNVRDQPSTAGKIMAVLAKGDPIQVEDAAGVPGWKKLVYGTNAGYFCSAAYLTATDPNS